MDNKTDSGKLITEEAHRWLGTPFEHHASVFQKGCDCVGLIIGVLKNVGLMDNDWQVEPYSSQWMLHHSEEKLLTRLMEYCTKIETIEPGDFILFQFGRCVSHIGIYIEDDLFIHAESRIKKVSFGVLKNSEWSERFKTGMRLNYENCPIA